MMEILRLIAANTCLSLFQKSIVFNSNSHPHPHPQIFPAADGGSTLRHSGQIATVYKIWPSSGRYSFIPRSMFMSTDFPEPLLPRIPKTFPSSMVIFKFFKILTSLKDFVTFLSSINDIRPPSMNLRFF